MASVHDDRKIVFTVLAVFTVIVSGNLLGAPETVDVKDKDVQEAAEYAVDELNKMSNSLYANKLVDVLSAEKQLVHGYNYILTIEIGTTTCKKNNGQDLDTCELDEEKEHSVCEVRVYVVQDRPEDESTMKLEQQVCTTVEKLH